MTPRACGPQESEHSASSTGCLRSSPAFVYDIGQSLSSSVALGSFDAFDWLEALLVLALAPAEFLLDLDSSLRCHRWMKTWKFAPHKHWLVERIAPNAMYSYSSADYARSILFGYS